MEKLKKDEKIAPSTNHNQIDKKVSPKAITQPQPTTLNSNKKEKVSHVAEKTHETAKPIEKAPVII